MLIHDVGEFGMLIVGIQAGPSCKWDLLLRCSTDRSVSTVLPLTDQSLYRWSILWPTTRRSRLVCFYHFFQRPNRTVHFGIETRCKIRNLKSSQQQRQTRPRNLCASTAKCRFRNVGAEGFQHAEDTRVEEDKQTMGGKNEGRAFCGDEQQWRPFRHVSLKIHSYATERLL